jgi:hypothetical protein
MVHVVQRSAVIDQRSSEKRGVKNGHHETEVQQPAALAIEFPTGFTSAAEPVRPTISTEESNRSPLRSET